MDAGWCLNAPTKWQQGTSISSTVVGQPSWSRTDTCIMPSGLDNVIGKPIGLENLCRPLFCTPGDTKIVKGPINIADPGPTDQPGPTTDPGPTDDPPSVRYRPHLSRFCTTHHNIPVMVSFNGGPWRRSHDASGTKDCSASDDDDDTTETDNDGTDDDTGGGDTNGDDGTNDDPAPVTCPALPSASTICEGQSPSVTCSDGTTRTVAGTKTTGTCICKDAWWTPAPYTCRKPNMLIQESNCDRERRVACTDRCLPNREGYRPLRSEHYTDEAFTQSNGCDERPATGTKHRPFSCPDLPNANTICHGEPKTVTCSDGRTTRTVYGTKTHCSCTDTCPCDQTYLAPDGSTPEAYAQTQPRHTTFKVTNECGDIDWVPGEKVIRAQSLAWAKGRVYWRRADEGRHIRKPAWVENGPVVDITYSADGTHGTPCDRNGKRVVVLVTAAFAAEFHVPQDEYTEYICRPTGQ